MTRFVLIVLAKWTVDASVNIIRIVAAGLEPSDFACNDSERRDEMSRKKLGQTLHWRHHIFLLHIVELEWRFYLAEQ